MDMIVSLILLYFLVFGYMRLSARIKENERKIAALRKELTRIAKPEGQQQSALPEKTVFPPKSPPPKPLIEKESNPIQTNPSQISIPKLPDESKRTANLQFHFKIPDFIKENWMGVVGSIAIVIGAVFFGLTSDLMRMPQARVGAMLLFSSLLLFLSLPLKKKEEWKIASGWVKSVAGAIILFAALGSGGIKGLQFIENPLFALLVLLAGIAINIFLAFSARSQSIASFHVALSIAALIVVPQAAILLPIATVIVAAGLYLSYRSKWDLNLIFILLAYALFNCVWTFSLRNELSPNLHGLAIASSLLVGMLAASIHYRKEYKSQKLELLPLLAHLANWGLMTWNILLHAENVKWTPFILAGASLAGFILARQARRKKIFWLYYTDTALSQMIAIAAIATLRNFQIGPMDVCILALAEIITFNMIFNFEKESPLVRIGYFLQFATLLFTACFIFPELLKTPASEQLPIYLRLLLVTALSWGFHLIGNLRGFFVDTFSFILIGDQTGKYPVSNTAVAGTLFFFGAYCFGHEALPQQTGLIGGLLVLAHLKNYREDISWNISFLGLMAAVHLINWSEMLNLILKHHTPLLFSRIDLVGVAALDFYFVTYQLVNLRFWKTSVYDVFIYAMAIQIGLLTYLFTHSVSGYIPGVAFLAYSILFLELAKYLPQQKGLDKEAQEKMFSGFFRAGSAFIVCFIIRYIAVHLQMETFWWGVPARAMIGILGLFTILYWQIFAPRENPGPKINQVITEGLLEAFLGLATLVVFVESPEFWRPLAWAMIAVALAQGSILFKWPKRLYLYSWGYLIASIAHVAFATSALTMPPLTILERFNLPAYAAIFVQMVYAAIVQINRKTIRMEFALDGFRLSKIGQLLFKETAVTVILPIFIGIAALFAFNYEKAVLTFMWVGLISIYLSLGLLLRSKLSIKIAMCSLLLCSIRLIVYDLVQSDIGIRALVFIGVGILMLALSLLYKKYKHRIEKDESD